MTKSAPALTFKTMTKQNTWICDSCSQPITKVEHGWVEWLSKVEEKKFVGKGLRLVHHCSAHTPLDTRCQYGRRAETDGFTLSDLPLKDFLGTNGLIDLLCFIATEQLPANEVLEMIKRLHVPGYEHARFHFARAISDGVFEPNTPPGYHSIEDINAVLKWAKQH